MISVFTSGYVNTETILHLFYKITDERGTKTVFTYAHVKWFYGQSEHAYYSNYFINLNVCWPQFDWSWPKYSHNNNKPQLLSPKQMKTAHLNLWKGGL